MTCEEAEGEESLLTVKAIWSAILNGNKVEVELPSEEAIAQLRSNLQRHKKRSVPLLTDLGFFETGFKGSIIFTRNIHNKLHVSIEYTTYARRTKLFFKAVIISKTSSEAEAESDVTI